MGKDLKDSKPILYVLNQLDANACPLEPGLSTEDDVDRAEICINNSFALGCGDVVGKRDIPKGNPKVNVVFIAEIFNTKHGLDDVEIDLAGLLDDGEGTKEERAFRLWINSLGIDGVFIDNLYEDLRDGIVLCKVCHRIKDGSVDWSRVDMKPNNLFKNGINC